MEKRLSKKWLWLILPVLLTPLVLTDSGFCYSENRFLNEREVIDRMLFGNKAETMSLEEKQLYSKPPNSPDYPNNCKISQEHPYLGSGSKLLNFLLGRKIYAIECVYPKEEGKSIYKNYYWQLISFDACSLKQGDFIGEAIKKQSYDSAISQNKKYWQEN